VFIVCCTRFLLFSMKEFLLWWGFLCYFNVFVGLHFVRQIFNFWVFRNLSKVIYDVEVTMICDCYGTYEKGKL
jgi:hypothetical protein